MCAIYSSTIDRESMRGKAKVETLEDLLRANTHDVNVVTQRQCRLYMTLDKFGRDETASLATVQFIRNAKSTYGASAE
jgi:hypothetical protein